MCLRSRPRFIDSARITFQRCNLGHTTTAAGEASSRWPGALRRVYDIFANRDSRVLPSMIRRHVPLKPRRQELRPERVSDIGREPRSFALPAMSPRAKRAVYIAGGLTALVVVVLVLVVIGPAGGRLLDGTQVTLAKASYGTNHTAPKAPLEGLLRHLPPKWSARIQWHPSSGERRVSDHSIFCACDGTAYEGRKSTNGLPFYRTSKLKKTGKRKGSVAGASTSVASPTPG